MLVVNYNGNKPITDYYKYGVEGNNNADVVRFVILKQQGHIDLTNNFRVFVKCQNDDFSDKVEIDEENIKVEGNNVYVDWFLMKKHTTQGTLQVSLCFEDEDEVVWQTQVFTLKIMNGVVADDEIVNDYPTILQQLQKQINEINSSNKSIYFELLPSFVDVDVEATYRGNLRVYLKNFTEDDVGTYLWLYRYSLSNHTKVVITEDEVKLRQTRKMAFRHPANYDSESTNNQKLGYTCLRGKKVIVDNDEYIWDTQTPNFMLHDGAVKTEYLIEQQHIEQGYMDIEIGREYLSMLRPDPTDMNNRHSGRLEFIGKLQMMGRGQYITYYQVANNEIKCMSKNMLFVYVNDFLPSDIVIDSESGHYHANNLLNIRLLPH